MYYSCLVLQHSAGTPVGWECWSKVLRFLCVQAQGKAVGGNWLIFLIGIAHSNWHWVFGAWKGTIFLVGISGTHREIQWHILANHKCWRHSNKNLYYRPCSHWRHFFIFLQGKVCSNMHWRHWQKQKQLLLTFNSMANGLWVMGGGIFLVQTTHY